MRDSLARAWYADASWTRLLSPLAWLYAGMVWSRRAAYRRAWLHSTRLEVPVIVIGNLTVGGTGKTPLVAAVTQRLRARGRRPGVVARGYGGETKTARRVGPDSDPACVGDEPVLLARAGNPVAVATRRVAAARLLVEDGVDVIVADDGLQHYALARDAEIAVVDAARGYGNRRLLPAGPLREPLTRLAEVDLELVQGEQGDFELCPDAARPLDGSDRFRPLSEFAGRRVHAVAGIGDPDRFFAVLRAAGLEVVPHAFPDHYRYRPGDIMFDDRNPVLMTEKDAVKCAAFADHRHWYLPVSAQLSPAATRRLEDLLDRVLEERA